MSTITKAQIDAPTQGRGWWRKRADEIELEVAKTGSREAMACYTQMRGLIQAVAATPTQVDAGAETGARAALFDAQHAIQDLLSWDAQRGFPLTYKVRDPLHVVLRSCLDALAAQGGQEAEPYAWSSTVMCIGAPGYGKERFDKLPIQSIQPGYYKHTPLYTHPPRTQGDTEMLDFMEHHRVLVTPEYEGPWEARVYGENEKPTITGVGKTPRAALAAAIARQGGKDGEA